MPADPPPRESLSVAHLIPHPLPDDLTEERLDQDAHRALVKLANQESAIVPGPPERVSDRLAVEIDGDWVCLGYPAAKGYTQADATARIVTWTTAVTRNPSPGETRVAAVEQPDGTWTADVPAELGSPGVLAVTHGLDTWRVGTTTLNPAGARVGHLSALPVSTEEVEVVVVGATARVVLELLPDEDEPEAEPAGG